MTKKGKKTPARLKKSWFNAYKRNSFQIDIFSLWEKKYSFFGIFLPIWHNKCLRVCFIWTRNFFFPFFLSAITPTWKGSRPRMIFWGEGEGDPLLSPPPIFGEVSRKANLGLLPLLLLLLLLLRDVWDLLKGKIAVLPDGSEMEPVWLVSSSFQGLWSLASGYIFASFPFVYNTWDVFLHLSSMMTL